MIFRRVEKNVRLGRGETGLRDRGKKRIRSRRERIDKKEGLEERGTNAGKCKAAAVEVAKGESGEKGKERRKKRRGGPTSCRIKLRADERGTKCEGSRIVDKGHFK